MAHVLGIPSPKDDIDGSQVAGVYYKEKNLNRIVQYFEKDVITVAQIKKWTATYWKGNYPKRSSVTYKLEPVSLS